MTSPAAAPYIGLRPYEESERDLFFGRTREAALIRNTILATPMTVLVAPSGAGKTSLLRTLVLPGLRELAAHVVYVDDWSDTPTAVLGRALGVAEGAEPLAAAEQLAVSHELGLILVLDQFEQVMLRHGDALAQLGGLLGALLRSGAEIRVVLTMREEYLASLDNLRPHILTVPQAMYRLAPLSGDEARAAIREPVRLAAFGGDVEPALLDRLQADLRGDAVAGGLAEASQATGVSAPFLQLVCQRLWAAVADKPDRTITLALYDSLGQRDGIVGAFVHDVTRALPDELRRDTARVLGLLAPRVGVKMAYPIDVLATQLGLPRPRVDAVLDNLDRARVIRRRERGEVVELFHDAFTRVLRPFVDEEHAHEAAALERARRRRFRRLTLGFVLLLAAIPLGVLVSSLISDHEAEGTRLAKLTSRGLNEASNQEELTNTTRELWESANQLTWSAGLRGQNRDKLRKDVIDRLQAITLPDDYVAALWGRSVAPAPEPSAGAGPPLTLIFPSVTGFGDLAPAIALRWNTLVADSNLPIPPLAFREDPRLPDGRVRLETDAGASVEVPLAEPPTADALTIHVEPAVGFRVEGGAPCDALCENLEVLHDLGVLRAGGRTEAGDWRADRWSAPLWHVLTRRSHDISVLPDTATAIAGAALERVRTDPSLYITPRFAGDLLSGVDANRLCLAREVEARLYWDHERCRPHAEECWRGARARLIDRFRAALIVAARRGVPPERWPDMVVALPAGDGTAAPIPDVIARLAGPHPLPAPAPDAELPLFGNCSVTPTATAAFALARDRTQDHVAPRTADQLLASIHLPPDQERWLKDFISAHDQRQLVHALVHRSDVPLPDVQARLPWLFHSLPAWHTLCSDADTARRADCIARGLLDTLAAFGRPSDAPLDIVDTLLTPDPRLVAPGARDEFIRAYGDPRTIAEVLHEHLGHLCLDITRDGGKTAVENVRGLLAQIGAPPVDAQWYDTCIELFDHASSDDIATTWSADHELSDSVAQLVGLHLLSAAAREHTLDRHTALIAERLRRPDDAARFNAGLQQAVEICEKQQSRDCILLIFEVIAGAVNSVHDDTLEALGQEFARQRIRGPLDKVERLRDQLLERVPPDNRRDFPRSCVLDDSHFGPLIYRLELTALLRKTSRVWPEDAKSARMTPDEARQRLLACGDALRGSPDVKRTAERQQALSSHNMRRPTLALDAYRIGGCHRAAASIMKELIESGTSRTPYELTLELFLALGQSNIERAAEIVGGPLREATGALDTRFHAALVHLLQGDGYEGYVRDFMYDPQGGEDRDYVRLLLWWRLEHERRDANTPELAAVWRAARDEVLVSPAIEASPNKADGAQSLDFTVWRAKLVRDTRNRRELTFTPKEYERRNLHETGQSYEFFACEVTFFEALRRDVIGDAEGYHTKLCEVIDLGCFYSYEYVMAEYLLHDLPACPANGAATRPYCPEHEHAD